MQLEDVNVVLRPRQHWEAIDLGFALVQRWLGSIYRAWFTIIMPLFILANLICWQVPWLAMILIWWLKPLLDRIPLYILSRALFGTPPSLRETLAALPGLCWPQSIAALTWLRFDIARSFHLPIMQLEGLRGKAWRARRRVLDRSRRGSGWLTIICLHLDMALQLALFGLFFMLFPEFIASDLIFWLEQFSLLEQVGMNLLALLALSIIEPFYVAAGFALYLNRRTILEAWDIEIGFRRLAERLNKHAAAAATMVLVLVLASPWIMPPPASAQQDNGADIVTSQACEALFERQEKLREADSGLQQTLAEVFEEPAFPHCRLRTHWQFWDQSKQRDPEQSRVDAPLLPGLAGVIEVLLWIAVAVFAALLIGWLVKRAGEARLPMKKTAAATPPPVHNEQATEREYFSDHSAGQAWQLWQQGRQRRALSLLYRASLERLTIQHHIDFGSSATEEECLRTARKYLPTGELLDFLQRLTRIWQRMAYAHRLPLEAEVQLLCRQWSDYFVVTTPPPEAADDH
jgi:hypothetical protein